ncbi:low-temperature-induced 65 kDa protein-like [Abrus precatorius]|uniref:Low-temperature-induced 65 kDa protein-like n=1 Tax=Abrus precatorius TaxID=3816 RepID=A0A8B8LPD5_ABRPR|nr:low-temperature-induced 65 kDa protein-like [Abrus precatorius]
MDSRADQTHAHGYDEHHHNSHNVGLQEGARGDEEHHHDPEKKSVMKKVKAKAKKIKDTITKHGHHDHEHGHEYHYDDQHIPDDHDLDEEDDEDEDMVENPEVHGAPIYDSSAARSATATPGQIKTLGTPGVNFGGRKIMGEEPHHEPRLVVVSPTSGINQSKPTDPTRTFVGGEKTVQPKVNLERPMDLEEDPHAPGSRTVAYDPANYQTKVTDPTGSGGAEIDITPVEKSFTNMTVQNQPKPIPEPKVLPAVAETPYSSQSSHHQFEPVLSAATKTHYPSAESYGQYRPELSSEIKTQYPKSHAQFISELPTPTNTAATKTHYPFAESYGQYRPELSSEIKTQYPRSHDQFISELPTPTNTHYPPARSHDQLISELPTPTNTQYPSARSHDQLISELPTPTNTQYPSARSHDQLISELPTPTNTHDPSAKSHDQYSATKSQYPSTGTHDDHYTATKTQYPSTGTHDAQHIATRTLYPSTGTHDQSVKELLTEPKTQQHYHSGKNHDQYLPQHSSATNTRYPSAGSHDQFLPEEFSTQPKTAQTHNTSFEEQPQQPSDQSSYTDKISSATSAIADKAVTAKNAVASKLGYGNENDNERHHEENTSAEKPLNQSSYTEKISSATSAIADKAVSAKNTVASKLGFGEKGDTEDNKVTTTNEDNRRENNASSPTEYGKRVALSLTEKLAPVYGKVAGVGSSVKSKVPGSERDSTGVGMEQDKGVSVKDYLVEKLRPSDEDRALSEVISETLYKKEPMEVTGEGEGRDVRKVVSDGVHKREEEPERRVDHHRPMGKVTESEEVKKRLGSEDEETEKRYEESYVNSPGNGVLDKLKGVVGSWFTKPGENQSSQEGEDLSRNYGAEVEHVNQGAGERTLQESSN